MVMPSGDDKEEKPKSESDNLFAELAGRTGIVPARKVELSPDDELPGDMGSGDGGGDLESRINSGRKKSDMEVVDKRLFPDLGYKHLNIMEVSRVFPDVFNPLLRIQVKSLIRQNLCDVERDKDGKVIMENGKPKKAKRISVAEAIALVNTSLTIAIDGEGRIDEIHVFGRSAESEDTKVKNSIGLP